MDAVLFPHSYFCPNLPEGADSVGGKLQALVYDILPSTTTAVFSYVIGSRKLSANAEQFFVGAQTVVSLLQTTLYQTFVI